MSDAAMLVQVREFVAEQMQQVMFGDGMERDYVRYGTEITGTYQMSDVDVVYEFLAMFEGEDVDDDMNLAQLLLWANAWYEQHKPATVPAPVNIHWSVEMTHGTDITTTHVLSGPDLTSLGAMLNVELTSMQALVDGGAYAPLTKLVVTLTEQ